MVDNSLANAQSETVSVNILVETDLVVGLKPRLENSFKIRLRNSNTIVYD